MIDVSETFRSRFPRAAVGVLVMTRVANPMSHPLLQQCKVEIEEELRQTYHGFDRPRLKQLPIVRAYEAHYRTFDRSYHVLSQVESVALKGKSIPTSAALVEAMFMAELKNMLLTAGHDLDKVKKPLRLSASAGEETYVGIRGEDERCKRGDMMIEDGEGVISSVLGGPDARTRITSETTRVLFTTYAPEGIGQAAVHAHLKDVERYVRLVSPGALTEVREVTSANGTGQWAW